MHWRPAFGPLLSLRLLHGRWQDSGHDAVGDGFHAIGPRLGGDIYRVGQVYQALRQDTKRRLSDCTLEFYTAIREQSGTLTATGSADSLLEEGRILHLVQRQGWPRNAEPHDVGHFQSAIVRHASDIHNIRSTHTKHNTIVCCCPFCPWSGAVEC